MSESSPTREERGRDRGERRGGLLFSLTRTKRAVAFDHFFGPSARALVRAGCVRTHPPSAYSSSSAISLVTSLRWNGKAAEEMEEKRKGKEE